MKLIKSRYVTLFKYLFVAVSGLLIITACSYFQDIAIPEENQDFSHFLNYNFTKPVALVYFLAAILIGYFFRLNPWLAGLCLLLFFPVTALAEVILDTGGHNLIPFEMLMYFVYALPSIAGVYIGKLIYTKREKRRKLQMPNS